MGGLSVAVALVSAPLWTYLAKRFDFRVPFVFGQSFYLAILHFRADIFECKLLWQLSWDNAQQVYVNPLPRSLSVRVCSLA